MKSFGRGWGVVFAFGSKNSPFILNDKHMECIDNLIKLFRSENFAQIIYRNWKYLSIFSFFTVLKINNLSKLLIDSLMKIMLKKISDSYESTHPFNYIITILIIF